MTHQHDFSTPKRYRNSLMPLGLAILAGLLLALVGYHPAYAGAQQRGQRAALHKGLEISAITHKPHRLGPYAPQLTPLAFVPVITATKTYTLTNDADSDGQADPGDTLQYTIVISNSGDMDGLNLFFTDILTNLLSLSGTVRTTPLALPDVYSATGNVQINIAAPGVLGNDLDLDGGPVTLTPFTGNSVNNGDVTLNGDGSFSYNPPAGFEGLDSFDYTISDDEGETDTGTVVINVTDMIWFIDNSAGAAGDGRLSSPFNSLAAFQGVNNGTGNNPAVGDNIFIYTGSSSYTGGVTLLDNQRLFGQGATASLAILTGITPPPGSDPLPGTGGASPTLTSGLNVINLANSNTIAGLNVAASSGVVGSAGIFGSGVGGTTNVNEVSIATSSNGNGMILNNYSGTFTMSNGAITGGNAAGAVGINAGTGVISLTNITVNKTGGGLIAVTNKTGGSVAFTSGSITGSGLNPTPLAGAILLQNNSGGTTITFSNGFNMTTSSGGGLVANNSGTVNIGGTSSVINATGGAAVDVTSTSLGSGWTFSGVSSTNSGTTGVNLVSITTGSFSANGGTISGATGTAFNVGSATNNSGGTTDISYAGAINNAAGRSVSIQERNGGTVTLSGNINDTGTGILVQNNNNGTANTVNFSGASKVLNTGANSAVTLDNNDDATINFTNGGLDIDATTSTGFNATGGAAGVNVTGLNNSIVATTGTALNILNTPIGVSGLTFLTITSIGGANPGIVLDTTGSSGGLTVTGDGGTSRNASGGTIQNKTGDSIVLNSTANVSLNYMDILGTGANDNGIEGTNVNGFILTYSEVSNHADNASVNEAPLLFRGLTGTDINGSNPTLIANSLIADGDEDNIQIKNESGTLQRLYVLTSTIGSTNFGTVSNRRNSNDGINFEGLSSGPANAIMNMTVQNNSLIGNGGDHINPFHNGTSGGSMDVVIINNNMNSTQSNPLGVGGGITIAANCASLGPCVTPNTLTYLVENNDITDVVLVAIDTNLGDSPAAMSMTGTIVNNRIGTPGVVGSGSSTGLGIRARANRAGTHSVAITNNIVRNWVNGGGIMVHWRDGNAGNGGGGTLNATITGNSLSEPGQFANGLHVAAGAAAGDTGTTCANVGGVGALANIFTSAGGFFGADVVIEQRGNGTAALSLTGYGGASTGNQAELDMQTYFSSRNTIGVHPNFGVSAGQGNQNSFLGEIGAGITGGAACPTP